MIKYNGILKIIFVGLDFDTGYQIHSELRTNSQNALWDFIDFTQNDLCKRMGRTKKVVKESNLEYILLKQKKLFSNIDEMVIIELIDMGVFGFFFIADETKLHRLVHSFFEDELTHNKDVKTKYYEHLI